MIGPEMGEDFEVTIEQGKTLNIKTLTPGIEVRYVVALIRRTLNGRITKKENKKEEKKDSSNT